MCIVHGSWNKKINHFLARSDTGVMAIYTRNECHARDTFASEIFMFSPRVGSCQQSAATGYRVGSSTKGNRLTLSVVWLSYCFRDRKKVSIPPQSIQTYDLATPYNLVYMNTHTRAYTRLAEVYICTYMYINIQYIPLRPFICIYII